MKFFLVSLVLAIQYACGCSLILPNLRGYTGYTGRCYPFDNEENMCGTNEKGICAPLIVRPRDVPKPSISIPMLNPVPGPCGLKKAIVKPAVIPKPVCLSNSQCTSVQQQIASSNSASRTTLTCGCSPGPRSTPCSCGGSQCSCGGTQNSYGISSTYVNQGSTGTPADAVSLNLAYKLARQQYDRCAQSEDRLAFGFKKLPIEIPQQRVVKTNIPEEQIYNLNGQIVELKPISICSQKSLDEEAAEDLLEMEAEEYAKEMEKTPIKKLYLEEIGYGPAKTKSAKFVDIPVSDTIVRGSATCGCSSSSSSQMTGCGCCKSSTCKEYLPGDVEYKVVPTVDDIVIPVPDPEDSCESAEINISQEYGGGCECQCLCTPVCVKTSQNRQQKKSSVFIQQYQG